MQFPFQTIDFNVWYIRMMFHAQRSYLLRTWYGAPYCACDLQLLCSLSLLNLNQLIIWQSLICVVIF